MKSVLIRTGSVPVQTPNTVVSGSRRPVLCRTGSLAGESSSKLISLVSEASRGRNRPTIRRISSAIETRILGEDDRSGGSRPKIGLRGGGGRGGDGKWSELGEYYERTLKRNPNDSLLLRNYGKYLHEVKGDSARAEECYGRAILTAGDGGDGELFSLYGRLIWETQRDEERAKSYFDRAVSVAPDDCTVLGSYAHFMWEAEEDEDENNTSEMKELYSELVPETVTLS